MTRRRAGTGARILVAAYGSSGDLFPLVPVVLRLRAAGHDVRFALPRPIALSLRRHGLPVWPLPRGAEMAVVDDPAIATTRFDGWASVRRLSDHHLGAALAADVAEVERVMEAWPPDVVVTSTFAAAARIAAHRRGIARVDVSLSPSVVARAPSAPGFALAYRARCAEVAGVPRGQLKSHHLTELAWGAGEAVLLHDPVLVRQMGLVDCVPAPSSSLVTRAVGFPYWDDGLARPADAAAVERWLDRSATPPVVVSMGSYWGARRRGLWVSIIEAIAALGVRALLLGPRRLLAAALDGVDADCLVAGFVPLSTIVERTAVMIHHGGLGTTFAALRSGTPAIVVPQAFDQPLNARIVRSLGAGRVASTATVRPVLADLLADLDATTLATQAVARRLTPSAEATVRAADQIAERL